MLRRLTNTSSALNHLPTRHKPRCKNPSARPPVGVTTGPTASGRGRQTRSTVALSCCQSAAGSAPRDTAKRSQGVGRAKKEQEKKNSREATGSRTKKRVRRYERERACHRVNDSGIYSHGSLFFPITREACFIYHLDFPQHSQSTPAFAI